MKRLLVLRASAPLVGRCPRVFYAVAAAVGWLAWHTRPRQRRNLARNMLPLCEYDPVHARKAGLRAYQQVARYWVDLCSLPYRDLAHIERDCLDVVHGERLAILYSEGPVIVLSAHTGNADLAVQALLGRGRPFLALVERLEPPAFGRELIRMRSAAGGTFVEAGFGGLRACVETLAKGGCVGLMGDRDIQGAGVCVALAGRRVKLPRGPFELARRSHAPVLPVLSSRVRDDRFEVRVEEAFCVSRTDDEEADIRAAAERWAIVLEAHLRRDPGQWTVLEDFWKVHACGEG